MERRQADRHIVITGASRGIGRAVAIRLAGEGANLSLLARDDIALAEVAEEARRAGAPSVFTATADVIDRAALDVAVGNAVAQHGPIHAGIAVAGVGGANADGPADRFDMLIDVNLGGTYRTLRAFQAHLAKDGRRDLVAFASILGRFGVPGYTGYCAAKAGVLGLVRAMALELAPQGIQVNAMVPGWVETDMAWQGLDGMAKAMGITREQAHAEAMKAVPLGKMGKPAEVAGVVAFLLSEDGAGITGQGIDVNNGAWMG